MTPAEKYPLWCVDTGRNTEYRYTGPFRTEEEARAEHDDKGGTVRRCRRLKVSEMDGFAVVANEMEDLVGGLNENPDGGPDGAWANWDEPVVEAKLSAETALLEWADKHLETRIYICEGDEE